MFNVKNFLDLVLIKEVVGPILIVLISVALYLIIKNVIDSVFRIRSKYVDKRKSKTINSLTNNLVKYFIVIVDVVMILDIFGIDTKTLLASLGIVGLVAGLAVQDTLKDFVAGFSIILENQFRVGDTVTIKGFRGEVVDLGLKSSKIRAYTGEVMIIANHLIDEVINHSLEKSVAIVDIPVSYDTDINKLEDVLNNLFSDLNGSLKGIKGNIRLLGLQSFDDSSVIYRVCCDTIPMEHFQVERDLKKAIKVCFDKNGIEIPFPQVVIHNGKRI
jgi:small conductance mechanosensitive channel